MATPPDFTTGQVLTAAQMNAAGLWLVTTCTVTSAGGTAATASNGVITIGSGNTSVTVSNAFSADYNNYFITIGDGANSSSAALQLRLGSTTTNYWNSLIYSAWTNTAQAPVGNKTGSYWVYAANGETNGLFGEIYIANPFLAKRTIMRSTWASANDTGLFTGLLDNTTSYTSFNITPNAGSMTGGTICVYGYRL